jgi:hypothetical protein
VIANFCCFEDVILGLGVIKNNKINDENRFVIGGDRCGVSSRETWSRDDPPSGVKGPEI